ncbi:FxSxx-COOH system tetratricopeptide repeat protein, partial [Frankia sp. CcI49]|uniref:FxSxx-COOH system tetratricopeptide repeat protein n=1 Tax=Frankia sp. CcI49 TaxID=1745382 RepID=UPI0009761B1A
MRVNDGGNTDSTDREGAGWYFFVSYAQADQPWAEWIAWTLEEAGYRVLVQDWDLTPGSHRVQWIHEGVQRAEQTIIVLSEEYTRSVYGTAEWQTAWAADPAGQTRKLLVARVADCAPPGLLAQIVPVDLFGLPEQQTQATLLRAARLAVSGARAKPDTKPPLPSGRQAMPGQPAFPGDRPEVWNIPPRLAHFVGRTDLLDQLHHDLTVAATVSVCAVRGLGGVGKTALAIEYAYRNAEAFEVAWWIPAEDPELIPDHLATLATALGLTPDADADWPTIHTHLRREQRRWLLILDNVEHPDVIDPFRPTDTLGRLVITTRRTGLARHGTTLNLQELTRPEAVDLLTRRVPHITPDTADTIADLLGDLPLAVEQAAGYLDQTGTPPDHYIAMLTDQLGDMLHRGHIPDRPHTTLATLWNHSLTQLITHHPAATTLLDLCALCAPDPIPLTLLTDRPDLVPDPGLRHAAEHPPIWNDTVGALVGYGLAHRDGSSLTLHRLTTAAIRTHMTPTTHTSTATTLAALLTDALPEDIDGHPQNWPQWRQLLPHVRALLDHHPDTIWSNNSQSAAWLADRTGIYLGHHGRPDTAIPYHQRALNLTETHLGPHHPDTLTSR